VRVVRTGFIPIVQVSAILILSIQHIDVTRVTVQVQLQIKSTFV
jgi:hypothetical protein